MAQLWPLEAPGNPQIGGILFVFPGGLRKTLQWDWPLPVKDSLGVSKRLAAQLLDDLMREGRGDEVRFTNWTSVTAAIQKHVKDWSEKRRQSLFALADAPKPDLTS